MNTYKKLLKMSRRQPKIGPADGLDEPCERFMLQLRRDRMKEIDAGALGKRVQLFERLTSMRPNSLLDALIRRQWLEPVGSFTYEVNQDVVRK